MTDFEKQQLNMRVTLQIDDQLTWGELYNFVDLARRSGEDPSEPVGIEHDENGMGPSGFYIYVADLSTETSSAT